MTDFKTGSVQANGINFHYLEMGEGPLALCLHGFPDHAYSFRHLLPDLAEAGFRAVAPFMRGYAPTEAPQDGNYRAVQLARDAVALVDALGDGQAYLIGNDWGAGAVIGASVLAPEKVRKLVIIASGRVDEELAMDYWYLRGTWHFYFFQMPFAERAVAHNDYAYVEQWWRDASPEWDIPDYALESIRETFRKPGVVEAALGYYRARFGSGAAGPGGAAGRGAHQRGPGDRPRAGPARHPRPPQTAGVLRERAHGRLFHRRAGEGHHPRNRPLHAPGEAGGNQPQDRGVPDRVDCGRGRLQSWFLTGDLSESGIFRIGTAILRKSL